MLKPGLLLSATFLILICSCKNERRYNYAIKDFRESLQPGLIKIVSTGIVMGYDSSLRHIATDKELVKLSQSEHPVLRASAFGEMLYRKSFNHFDILMNHLSDTAMVVIDGGEFGLWYRTVSDYILEEAEWQTQAAKDKTIEQVLTKHNYLRSAYTILIQIEPQKKYYEYIKDMASRPRRLDQGYELAFDEIEYALYGLAQFRKKEDVEIIKKQMMENVWRLGPLSFLILKQFPDTAYFDIFQTYHRQQFYSFSGYRRNDFTRSNYYGAEPEDFIFALVKQQNDRSARLLDTILNRLPRYKCMPEKERIERALILDIWEHPNPSYTRLRKKVKSKVDEYYKGMIGIPIDPVIDPKERFKESLRW